MAVQLLFGHLFSSHKPNIIIKNVIITFIFNDSSPTQRQIFYSMFTEIWLFPRKTVWKIVFSFFVSEYFTPYEMF